MYLRFDREPQKIQHYNPLELQKLLLDQEISKGGRIKEGMTLFVQGPRMIQQKEEDWTSWTFSTPHKDRDQEVVDQEGWQLEQYRNNPVILWAHNSFIPAIGISKDIENSKGKLGGHIQFNQQDYDPFGWSIGERVRRGIIQAGSVGFRPLEISLEKMDGEDILVFRRQELLEFSICNVPANPFALQTPQKRKEQKLDFWGGLLPMEYSDLEGNHG